MDPAPACHIPRTGYGLVMLIATLVAAAGAWLVASRLGPGGEYSLPLLLAIGVGSAATFVPVLLSVDKDHWGVVVLGAGVGRSLIVLVVCYSLQPENLTPRPLFMGALTCVLTLLVVETVMAVRILSSIERQRVRALTPVFQTDSTSRNPA